MAELLQAPPEPIAIVGMGCRFPGGADDPDAFWRLLEGGRDAVTEVPEDRWDIDAYYDPNPDAPGKLSSRWGSFIRGVDQFDAQFFGIGAPEALRMDAHQRVLLEVVWEALEHAGMSPDSLAGSRTGVFIGIYHSDFIQLQLVNPGKIDIYSGTGTSNNVAAGRISYLFDFQGPSLVVDTACSSSLVALHLACQSLRNNECNMAIAGGVTLLLSPLSPMISSRMHLLARDGRCKTFDARADGIALGDGCGVVVLKRLKDAIAAGDNVLASIRGSAVNQDGRTNGLTAPNVLSQQALLRQALSNARLKPSQISYIEAHGTGTSLGDPIEIEALSAVIGEPRRGGTSCGLGALKTNMGHLGAAAGVAGLIKTVLCLQHKKLVPNLHFQRLNPNITLENTPFFIPTAVAAWDAGEEPRRAGVSAFGWSGTNAHVVVEEAPAPAARGARPQADGERTSNEGEEISSEDVERPRHLLVLSARSAPALDHLAHRYERYLEAHASLRAAEVADVADVANVCYTAGVGRAHMTHRLAVEGESLSDLRERLAAFRERAASQGVWTGTADKRQPLAPVFLFSGQGAQYPRMGWSLYRTQPTFRRVLDRCDEILRPFLGRSLVAVMHSPPEAEHLLDQTLYTQPAMFALGYALAELWRAWGIQPAAVMGHSVGEYVAACVAGVFSLEDGLRLIAERARRMQELPRDGLMAATFAGEAQVAEVISRRRRVSIAAINGPTETVISGDADEVRAALAELGSSGVKTRVLSVSHAFHSPLMDPLLDAFEKLAATVRFAPPRIPLVSNVTGALIDGEEVASPAYWRRHLREPVAFAAGIATLHERGHGVFIEMGPHPTLLAMARWCLPDDFGLWLPSLQKGKDDWLQMLSSLGAWYARGGHVDWSAFDRDYPRRRVVLPSYPFQRERYPLELSQEGGASPSGQATPAAAAPGEHPLLGRRIHSPSLKDVVFEASASSGALPFLNDHRIYDLPVLPMTAYLEAALSASAKALGPELDVLSGVVIQKPMIFRGEQRERIVQVILRSSNPGAAIFEIYSREEALRGGNVAWTLHASGEIRPGTSSAAPGVGLEEARRRCARAVPVAELYGWLERQGLQYGPGFRGLVELWGGEQEALGRLEMPEALVWDQSGYRIHPAFLDACDQVFAAAMPGVLTPDSGDEVCLPVGLERMELRADARQAVWSHARLRPGSDARGTAFTADLVLFDAAGKVVGEIGGLTIRRAPRAALRAAVEGEAPDRFYQLAWRSSPLSRAPAQAPGQSRGTWIVLADGTGAADQLVKTLVREGHRCVIAIPGEAYAQKEPQRFVLRPGEPVDFQRLAQALLKAGEPDVLGLVHLWSLDSDARQDDVTEASLRRAQELGCASVLHLVQALGQLPAVEGRHPRLWLVTRGTQAAGAQRAAVGILGASLWGLGRTIALELPALQCSLVDLDAEGGGVEMLSRELLADSEENQVALRGGQRYVARLARASAELAAVSALASPPRVRADGSYLITGGLGGLGLHVARWLVARGAKHLVLMGRRAAAAEAAVRELEGAGARVKVARADVSRAPEVAAVLDEIRRTMPPLRGVFHCAGVADDGVLLNQDWAHFASVMSPKLEGGFHLHALTRDLELDHFVLFSSIASVFGAPGQGGYAAANAFLDALAHHRRARRLPALSINWGAWSDVGMAARMREADQRRIGEQGLEWISPDQGIQALESVMQATAAQVAVVQVDWQRFMRLLPASAPAPFYTEVAAGVMASVEGARAEEARKHQAAWRRLLTETIPSQREEVLRTLVWEEAIRALGLDPAQRPDFDCSLYDLGLNSLGALDLTARLGMRVGYALPPTMLFSHATVAAIASYLMNQVLPFKDEPGESPAPHTPGSTAARAEQPKGSPAAGTTARRMLERIEELSDEEVESLFSSRLKR
ncbi:SDR family NAD(P)-dependent oxidoreductase [Sorangium sp. So ce1389]|uniref:type I polyketide synthase n=1 Tax=Sorangium sp. So ce1389 TaxID=3133336 RepID=UPI003F5F8FCB